MILGLMPEDSVVRLLGIKSRIPSGYTVDEVAMHYFSFEPKMVYGRSLFDPESTKKSSIQTRPNISTAQATRRTVIVPIPMNLPPSMTSRSSIPAASSTDCLLILQVDRLFTIPEQCGNASKISEQ